MIRVLMIIAALTLFAISTSAHTASRSFSSWRAEGATLTAVFETDARRATQLPEVQARRDSDLGAGYAAHLAANVSVSQAGAPCVAEPPSALAAETGAVRARLIFVCAAPIEVTPTTLKIAAFFAVSPTHVHYLRLQAGALQIEDALSVRRSEITVGAGAAPSGFFGFVRSGAEHVLGGLDHLAFLLALTLLAGRPLAAALAATGFTVGHSVTLSLVALGLIKPHEAGIEALIGFTIAFAAAEALRPSYVKPHFAMAVPAGLVALAPIAAGLLGFAAPPSVIYLGAALFMLAMLWVPPDQARRATPLLAAMFGLAHGAGFAGALTELDLPRDRLVSSLFGFNLGVEIGQLMALAGFGLVAFGLTRLPPQWRGWALQATAAGLLALGVYWFAGRTFAPLS
jgi:hypothetical protein